MASSAQIEANRRNSQKSTGPRTGQGKAAARFNALKTGIHAESLVIPGENHADLNTLTAEYHERFQPSTPEQRLLVDNLVANEWQLRRLRKVESQVWSRQIAAYEHDTDESNPLAHAHSGCRESLILIQRRLDSADRACHRAINLLRRLRPDCFEPESAAPPPDSRPQPPDAPEIGFVPRASRPSPPEAQPGGPNGPTSGVTTTSVVNTSAPPSPRNVKNALQPSSGGPIPAV